MKTFELGKSALVKCFSEDDRKGFVHRAVLYIDGHEQVKVKVHYFNRTWERFQYQTVLDVLAAKKGVPPAVRENLLNLVKNGYS